LALRAVVFAGEKLEMAELRPWTDRFGFDKPVLVNMYGITETTVHTTFYRVVAEDVVPQAPNRVGVPGEIYVGGAGVARGYANRPELTAARFVPDPYGPAGARLYRSGDLARRRQDGSLEFLGRVDDQVKIRGYRVELGEIQTLLSGIDGVRDAVVILREEALVAYLVGDPPPAEHLRTVLGRSLPGYMVPSAFVVLDQFPLTVNGKLDKSRLPDPDRATVTTTSYTPPRTPTEHAMATVWAQTLNLPTVGIHDNFFDLGGHSIRAVALAANLRDHGYPTTVKDIFEHRTVAELAAALGEAVPDAGTEEVALVEPFQLISAADRARLPAGVTDAYPLSQVQAGMVAEMPPPQ
jgi:aryl carrier-like protein